MIKLFSITPALRLGFKNHKVSNGLQPIHITISFFDFTKMINESESSLFKIAFFNIYGSQRTQRGTKNTKFINLQMGVYLVIASKPFITLLIPSFNNTVLKFMINPFLNRRKRR